MRGPTTAGDALLAVRLVREIERDGNARRALRELELDPDEAARLVGARAGGWSRWVAQVLASPELARERRLALDRVKRRLMAPTRAKFSFLEREGPPREVRERPQRRRQRYRRRQLRVRLDGRWRVVVIETPR